MTHNACNGKMIDKVHTQCSILAGAQLPGGYPGPYLAEVGQPSSEGVLSYRVYESKLNLQHDAAGAAF